MISFISTVNVFNCLCVTIYLLVYDKLRTNCFTNKVHLREIDLVLFVTFIYSMNPDGQWQGNIIAHINKIHSNLEKIQYIYIKH